MNGSESKSINREDFEHFSRLLKQKLDRRKSQERYDDICTEIGRCILSEEKIPVDLILDGKRLQKELFGDDTNENA